MSKMRKFIMSNPNVENEDFSREELEMIISRAEFMKNTVNNSHWKRAFENFILAADYLDAIIARTHENERMK